jgi:hypothetical protein
MLNSGCGPRCVRSPRPIRKPCRRIETAKNDGRWAAAYASQGKAEIPSRRDGPWGFVTSDDMGSPKNLAHTETSSSCLT